MKILVCFLVLLFWGFDSKAQKENNVWLFGDKSGFDFNVTGGPVFLGTSKNMSFTGGATVCDSAGKLLFYCDGRDVFDASHSVMPNGSGMAGYIGTTQGVVIAKVRGDDSLYFLFCLAYNSMLPNARLSYSIVNIKLNGGKGDVIASKKNIPITNGLLPKMIVANGCGMQWLLVHRSDSSIFYAYPLVRGGIIASPIKSDFGYDLKSHSISLSIGELCISEDFSKIAVPSRYTGHGLSIFDFDMASGKLSNYVELDSITYRQYHHGVAFSPDGTKLYASSWHPIQEAGVYQFDLSAGSLSAIRASRVIVDSGLVRSFKLAVDGMIYFKNLVFNKDFNCDRIREPNKSGLACNIQRSFFVSGLPEPMYSHFGSQFQRLLPTNDTLTSNAHFDLCKSEVKEFRPRGNMGIVWNDGDTSSLRLLPSTPQNYWVESFKDCVLYIDSIKVSEKPSETTNKVFDTIICFEPEVLLSAPKLYTSYLWSNGSTKSDTIIKEDCNINVKAIDQVNCNILDIDYRVRFVNFLKDLKDTFICNEEPITLDATVTFPDAKYKWNNGETTSITAVKGSGVYTIRIDALGCELQKQIKVGIKNLELNIGEDRTVCEGKEIILKSNILDGNYLWSTKETTDSIKVDKTGEYSVVVNKDGCADTAEAFISFEPCIVCVNFPNSFSPNGDGINDYFKPLINCPANFYEFKVFTRWGKEIFNSNSSNIIWDGTQNGIKMNLGVYFYTLKITFEGKDEKPTLYKGDVTLLR